MRTIGVVVVVVRPGNMRTSYLIVTLFTLGVVSAFMLDDLTIPVDRSIPRIRPLRRQIRHFEPGKIGQITVIYQTSHPDQIKIRWFRKAMDLANAEISDHLTIEGDPRYRLKFLAISDVRAVTLRVTDVALWEFPMSFVLVMTAGQPPVEYQLDTVIEEPLPFTYDDILDEIRWVALPPSALTFSYHGSMSATCVAVVDSESESITDELNMYRVTFEKDRWRLKKGILNPALKSPLETESIHRSIRPSIHPSPIKPFLGLLHGHQKF
ncbi:hypothetical protein LSH36_64g00019 [Paralvinella palmiformis]|uniref:Uncharacterized protein n=1 Tax=Paralvinella palmiformis TaxID=53620 RepID=A0AAD9K4U8_9ANNE|nr:hypothetical protein LSH36_64g00019 [Paralvinella palmiformis]